MKALQKKVGQPWEVVEIANELKALHEAVGGYIETMTLTSNCCLIINEEGRILGLPENCIFLGVRLVGNILMVGVDGDEFTDVPELWIEEVQKWDD